MAKKNEVIKMVQCVNAEDMPDAVEKWCDEHNISTHCATELHSVHDDGNPLSKWLKSVGFKFDEKRSFMWVGIWGT